MEKRSNLQNIIIIIVCIAIVISVVIYEHGKDRTNVEEKEEGILTEQSAVPVQTSEPKKDNSEVEGEPAAEEELIAEELPDGVEQPAVYFGGTSAYDYFEQLPVDTVSVLNERFSSYITKYIVSDEEVGARIKSQGEMTLIEDTFKIEKKKCYFATDLNNGFIVYVTIDLSNNQFVFSDNGGIE